MFLKEWSKSKATLGKTKIKELREMLAKKAKVSQQDIFVDSSVTPTIPLAPSKKEPKYILLVSKKGTYKTAKKLPISKIPIVSAMSGFMHILRIYTTHKNRKKVEMAAKSILGDLK